MKHHLSVDVLLLLTGVVAGTRDVSFWYGPASYGGEDMDAVVSLMANHSNTVSSVMIYCGHGIGPGGTLSYDAANAAMCLGSGGPGSGTGLIRRLRAVGVIPEIVLNSGTSNITDFHLFWANDSMVEALVQAVTAFQAGGINLDLEPTSSAATDAAAYAAFCTKVKAGLEKLTSPARLTVAVAQWSPMLAQYATLAPTVHRLLDMETYNAGSMTGWLDGDGFGGDYVKFIDAAMPRDKAGPGLGCWPAKCGTALCWSATEPSGKPRVDRMIADDVPEMALFRLIQIPKANLTWPQDWWWPLLDEFAASA